MIQPTYQLMNTSGDMVNASEFLKPYVIDHIAGFSSMIFEQYTAMILQDFLKQVPAWKETFMFDSVQDAVTYQIPSPEGARLEQLFVVYYVSGREAEEFMGTTLISEEVLESNEVDRIIQRPGKDYTVVTSGKVADIQFKCAKGTQNHRDIEMIFSLRPEHRSLEVPEAILEDNYDALAAGIMSKMQLMPNKPWSDSSSAIFHQAKYIHGMSEARIKINRGMMGNDKIQLKVPRGYRF